MATKRKRKSAIKNRWVKTKTLGRSVRKNASRGARFLIKKINKGSTVYFRSLSDYKANRNGKRFAK